MSLQEYKPEDEEVSAVEKIVQEFDEKLNTMFRSLEQSNIDRTDRLVGLITIANYEATLAERMIQNKYFCNGNSKNTYDELSKNIAKTMVERLEESDTIRILELKDQIKIFEMDIAKLHKQVDALKQNETIYQKRCSELADTRKEAVEAVKAYSALVKWHEKCERDVPALQKKNSGLIFKQSLEDAMAEFEQRNPKPKVPSINF